MFKKIVIAGLTFSNSAAYAENSSNKISKEVLGIMDDLGKAENVVCQKLLDYEALESLSAQEISDRLLLNKIVSRITDSPVAYCAEKVLMSQERVVDPEEKDNLQQQ